MLITGLDLENFGPFADDRLLGLRQGLTVIHGPNEVGKSALRAFLRVVLFGFPDRRERAARELYYYAPDRGGEARGTILIRTAGGEEYSVHRREGRRGGPVTVSGAANGAEERLAALMRGMSADLYQSVFSIGLGELQGIEQLPEDRVRDLIYSAGFGASGTSLPDVIRSLDDRLAVLRRPRSGRLVETLAEISATRGSLAESVGELGGYERATREIEALNLRAKELADGLAAARSRNSRIERLVRLRPHWIRKTGLEQRLEAMAVQSSYPEDGLDRLGELLASRDGLDEEIRRGDLERDRVVDQLRNIPVVAAFVDREADIRRVLNEITYYEEAAHDLPLRERERREMQRVVDDGLARLGESWSRTSLDAFQHIDEARGRIGDAGKSLATAAQAADKATDDLARAVDERDTAEAAVEEARLSVDDLSGVPSESEDVLSVRLDRLDRLAAALTDRDAAERELWAQQAVRGAAGPPSPWRARALAALVGALGIAAIGWGLTSADARMLVFGAIAVAVAIAGEALGSRRHAADAGEPGPAEDASRVLRERLIAAGDEVERLAAKLGIADSPRSREVVESRSGTDRALTRRSEYERRRRALADRQREAKAARSRLVAARAANETARAEKCMRASAWRETLAGLSLREDLDLPGAVAALGDVERLQSESRRLDDLDRRIAGMRRRNGPTEETLAAILEAASLPGFQPGAGGPALLDLQARWEEHQRAVAARAARQQEVDDWALQRADLVERAEALDAEIAALVDSAGCADVEEFRRTGQTLQERATLERDLQQLLDAQPDLRGPDAAALELELAGFELEDAESETAALADEIGRLQEERDRVIKNRAEREVRQRQLATDDAVGDLQMKLGELTERLREDARRWGVLTIARTLLEETRDQFQTERQPELLRLASTHFRDMTGGRYSQVRAVLGEERFEVVMGDTRVRQVTELSRGATEQLWLAIRFALIDEYARHAESMPVLMDDVMVNFDPERAHAASRALVGLAQRHQVLVLTCHPATVDMLRAAAASKGSAPVNVVNLPLSSGAAARGAVAPGPTSRRRR